MLLLDTSRVVPRSSFRISAFPPFNAAKGAKQKRRSETRQNNRLTNQNENQMHWKPWTNNTLRYTITIMTPKDHVLFETTVASDDEFCWPSEGHFREEVEEGNEEAEKMGPHQDCGLLLRQQRTTVSVQTLVAYPNHHESGWQDESPSSDDNDEDDEADSEDDISSTNSENDEDGNESVSDEEEDVSNPHDSHYETAAFTITTFLEVENTRSQSTRPSTAADLYALCTSSGPLGGLGLESIEEMEEKQRRQAKEEEDEKLVNANLHRRCIQFSEQPQIKEYEGIPLDLYKDLFYSCHQLQHFIEEANEEKRAEALFADA